MDAMFSGFIDQLADAVAARLGGKSGGTKGAAKSAGRVSRRTGRKLDMSCRVEGCKNMSRGPRFGFICDDHRKKLSKKDQAAAREAFKAQKGKA